MKIALASIVVLVLLAVAWMLRDGSEIAASPVAPATSDVTAGDLAGLDDAADAHARDSRAESRNDVATSSADSPTETPTGVKLFGKVLPAAGRDSVQTIVGISVYSGSSRSTLVHTASDDTYVVDDLEPGRCWVVAQSAADGSARAMIELDLARPEHELDLQLELAPEIAVRVIDTAGVAVRDFDGYAFASSREVDPTHGDEWPEDSSGVGAFRRLKVARDGIPDDAFGVLTLESGLPAYVNLVRHDSLVASQRVLRGASEVTFVLDDDALAKSVVRVRFRPIDGSTREALSSVMAGLHRGRAHVMLERDASGAMVGRCAPGRWTLKAAGTESTVAERGVVIPAAAEVDLGEIALTRASGITGEFVDESGQGLWGSVTLEMIDGEESERPTPRSEHTSPEGHFAITALPRARYLLIARSFDVERRVGSLEVSTSVGSLENVLVRAQRCTPLVLRPTTSDWQRLSVDVFDLHGVNVGSTRFERPFPVELAIAPGRYEVSVSNGVADPRWIPLTIAGEPVELDLP